MDTLLSGSDVAILVVDGFEQVELTGPKEALEQAGVQTRIVSAERGQVLGFHHHEHGDRFEVDLTFGEADVADFDAVLLPGGVINGDAIRLQTQAQQFVRDMAAAGKPVAAICHGGWLLASAGVVRGRRLTSWPSLQDDLRNAGAEWVDEEVVVDGNLITSRKPDDIPAFSRALLQALGERYQQNARRGGELPQMGATS